MWTLDKMDRRFISNNQADSNEGNNWREQSEGNTDNTSSTLKEGTPPKKVQGTHSHTIHAGPRGDITYMSVAWNPDLCQGKQNY